MPFSITRCFLYRKEELSEGKEKVTTSEECELVTLMSIVKGRLEISRGWICFWDAGLGCETADRERADFKFALSQLQEVHLRRYNLRRSALEFFLVDHTTYFVNFNTKVNNIFIFEFLATFFYVLITDAQQDLQSHSEFASVQSALLQQPISSRCSPLVRTHSEMGAAGNI